MYEYLISENHAPHCYGGRRTFRACRTYGRPWHIIRERLSPDACNYAVITAPGHRAAVVTAKTRWA